MRTKISRFLPFALLFSACSAQSDTYKMMLGTYTQNSGSKGIYAITMPPLSCDTTVVRCAASAVNPSYLALSPDKTELYVVYENASNSAIAAFSLDSLTDSLIFINSVPTTQIDPCYIAVSRSHIITAGYSDGTIQVHERMAGGSIGALVQTINHTGSGMHAERQSMPHVHQTIFSADQKFLLACDLGADKIVVYSYDIERNSVLKAVDSIKMPAGSGVRHLAVGKNGAVVYAIGELDGAINVISLTTDGHPALLQQVPIASQSGEQAAAAIRLAPDGMFLYATNRGNANDIACFAVKKDGMLSLVQRIPTGGVGPRDFTITNDGKYLFIAHQYSNNVIVFARNAATGKLTPTSKEYRIPAPVCLVEY
jgi:6-phosphogluconolactonase